MSANSEAASGRPSSDRSSSDRPWSPGFRTLALEHDYRVEEIDGRVPLALRGTLFRNGSGRNDLGGEWFPHWFDGDGMISAIRFDDGGIHYRNRYVRTPNYCDETRAGRIVYRGFGKMRPGGVLGNALRKVENVSNTSVIMLKEKLLSLWEGGPPFALDPDTLETLGLEDFGGRVKTFSAHPKLDPATGELFNFGIDYGAKTTLTAYRIDRGGELKCYPAIALPDPVMNHDFVLTERYLVFCLGPILVHPLKMLLGFASFDGALRWDGGRPTRILLVPRDGGAPKWIETDAFFQFHFANGFDEDGAVVLDLTRYPDYLGIGDVLRNYWHSDWQSQGMASLVRLRIDPASGRVETRSFDTGTANEFPRIDPRRVARRHRYAYIANNPPGQERGLQQLVTRIDLDSGATVSHDFRPNGYAGEPVFIPSSAQDSSAQDAEDEGCVVTLVFDAERELTDIVGLDARDLAARPLFVARLKHHVPFSLHGHFVPADAKQPLATQESLTIQ
jgi:all-trans-8'-apo-beta-carotenal 15,15'-oxygenase